MKEIESFYENLYASHDEDNNGAFKTLWLNDRQPVKVFKTLNDRQFYIFDKFRKIE